MFQLHNKCGFGLVFWSSLADDFPAGTYYCDDSKRSGESRLSGFTPVGDSRFTDRNRTIQDVLKSVAAEADRPPADVAVALVVARPSVDSLPVGASRKKWLRGNLAALTLELRFGARWPSQTVARQRCEPDQGDNFVGQTPMLERPTNANIATAQRLQYEQINPLI